MEYDMWNMICGYIYIYNYRICMCIISIYIIRLVVGYFHMIECLGELWMDSSVV